MTLAVPVSGPGSRIPGGGRANSSTQTGGDTADPADGYAVVDDSEARFWTAFEEFGGVAGVGYPVSRRFIWDGFVTQVMQKAVFQWRPDEQATAFVNVFDDLHRLGFDGQLADELVPEQEEFDETGLSWPQILEKRVALLDEEPLLRPHLPGVRRLPAPFRSSHFAGPRVFRPARHPPAAGGAAALGWTISPGRGPAP